MISRGEFKFKDYYNCLNGPGKKVKEYLPGHENLKCF